MNKKGIISSSAIYGFFIVFILIMLSIILSFANKRLLLTKLKKNEKNFPNVSPDNSKCTKKNNNYLDVNGYIVNDVLEVVNSCTKACKGEFTIDGATYYKTLNNTITMDKDTYEDSCAPCPKNSKLASCIFATEQYEANNNKRSNYLLKNGSNYSIELSNVTFRDDLAIQNVIDNRKSPSFSNIENNSAGLYMMNDDFGKSYYYRGKEDYNYVSFGGFTWRIVRVNGDGTIRLILDKSIGTSLFTEAALSNDLGADKIHRNGYMSNYKTILTAYYDYNYSNEDESLLASKINDWYGNNLSSNSKFISQTSIFCGDKNIIEDSGKLSASGNNFEKYFANIDIDLTFYQFESLKRIPNLSSTPSPVLTCPKTGTKASKDCHRVLNFSSYSASGCEAYDVNKKSSCSSIAKINTSSNSCTRDYKNTGNGDLKYPVATISADEVLLAGGVYNKENKNYYLYNGQKYWTMTLGLISHSIINTPKDYGLDSEAGDKTKGAYYYTVSSKGNVLLTNSRTIEANIRPVINLKSCAKVSKGDGTVRNPYVITEGC